MERKLKRDYQILNQPVDCRWFPGANSFREYNPDKPTRTDIRAHRRLLDQLLAAGDITTARKIVDTHPYLRDYEPKIRQLWPTRDFRRPSSVAFADQSSSSLTAQRGWRRRLPPCGTVSRCNDAPCTSIGTCSRMRPSDCTTR